LPFICVTVSVPGIQRSYRLDHACAARHNNVTNLG
jgi:hypothetical protein